MDDAAEESAQRNCKLRRQKSRLQMQAPSAIQVGRAQPAAVAEWRAAIPLLSPLDVSTAAAVPRADGTATADDEAKAVGGGGGAWRHPAAPFYYEPAPGSAPAFVF